MARILCRIIGSALCFIGIIGMLTPIPFGIIFFVIGLMFLVPSTPSAARLVQKARKQFGLFDKSMSFATNKMPYPYRRILRRTEIDPIE
ncbi:hypothetical protein QGN29_00880 [Temperatibacter marinus]|uniref:Transmembrane protein (PGPGW) n=1 Tax=Temperatibacter marinus TaxID=1456591 RepID=A0AA52H984_9PROT|nr:hypothetical protein [Temperatibacter marinus]WND02916.1 hypothetical protein QGN29_00880 [Temperatibacter marinus]